MNAKEDTSSKQAFLSFALTETAQDPAGAELQCHMKTVLHPPAIPPDFYGYFCLVFPEIPTCIPFFEPGAQLLYRVLKVASNAVGCPVPLLSPEVMVCRLRRETEAGIFRRALLGLCNKFLISKSQVCHVVAGLFYFL